MFYQIIILSLMLNCANSVNSDRRPNIFFIMADDYGWNDVSWHNRDMPTPNLDFLARHHGVILNQSYVNQVCSPTRSAFFTGYYPYHLGTEYRYFVGMEPSGVPLKFTFISQRLQRLGYKTYMVGKWHLGYCNESYIPNTRGFDEWYGYYMGSQDYFTHKYSEEYTYKLSSSKNVACCTLCAELYANKTIQYLRNHNRSQPFFIYLAFQAVHSPLQVPDKYLGPCMRYRNQNRRKYCGMAHAMDIAVGKIVNFLKLSGQYENTIIIFNTDNGGQVLRGGNNYPLRGNKNTLWEGGNRAISFLHSKRFIHQSGVRQDQLFSIVDWFPTILSAAGQNVPRYGDGINQWEMIVNNTSGKRSEFVYNIYQQAAAIRQGRYKLIVGKPGTPDGWIPVPNSKWRPSPQLRRKAGRGPWLFDIKRDPTEHVNLARKFPRRVRAMKKTISLLRRETAPSAHRPLDPRGDPKG